MFFSDTDVTYPFNDMTITNLQPTNLKPSIDRNSKVHDYIGFIFYEFVV